MACMSHQPCLQDELASLQNEMSQSSRRIENAHKLTSALSDERVRWSQTADQLEGRMQHLEGDILLSAASLSYLGAFNGWCHLCYLCAC